MENQFSGRVRDHSRPDQATPIQASFAPPGDGGMGDFFGRVIQLKGSASTILIILLLANRPFSKQRLHALTGAQYRTIRRALGQLEKVGAVAELENQQWRISESWHSQFFTLISAGMVTMRANVAAKSNGHFDQSGSHFDQSGSHFDQSGSHFDQSGSHLGQSGSHFDQYDKDVVVDNMYLEIQQQQSLQTSDFLSITNSRFDQSTGYLNQPDGHLNQPDGHFDQSGGTFDQSAGILSHSDSARRPASQGKLAPTSVTPSTPNKQLSGYLRRMGVIGRAYKTLVARHDLILDPAPVLAWWWYALTQEDIRQPAALAISCLKRHDPAPAGFLDLVRLWPKVTPKHRLAIEEMVQRNWEAEQLARHWSKSYPECTARMFIALKELYLADPAALGL